MYHTSFITYHISHIYILHCNIIIVPYWYLYHTCSILHTCTYRTYTVHNTSYTIHHAACIIHHVIIHVLNHQISRLLYHISITYHLMLLYILHMSYNPPILLRAMQMVSVPRASPWAVFRSSASAPARHISQDLEYMNENPIWKDKQRAKGS